MNKIRNTIYCLLFSVILFQVELCPADSKLSSHSRAPGMVDSFDILLGLQQKMLDAIDKGDTKKLSKYLSRGYDINRRNEMSGTTLLLEAIIAEKKNVVAFLLMEGADPNIRAAPFHDAEDNLIPEESPLEEAIVNNDMYDVAQMLINHGANVNDTDIYYGTALSQVLQNAEETADVDGNSGIDENTVIKKVRWLISHGADVNKADSYGETPLYRACSMNFEKAALLLVNEGANVKIKSSSGETPLFRLQNTELAKLCIKKGVDVNAQSNDGLTALHHAVFSNDLKMAKLLVKNGADLNLSDYDSGLTPLDWITIEFSVYSNELVRLLISSGAVINYELARQYGVEEQLRKIASEIK